MDFGAINKGVVAYFAEGGSSADHTNRDSAFAGAHELLQAVVAIVRESLAVPAHWNTTSPEAGAVIVKHEMKRRHVGLDESALSALGANYASECRGTGSI